MDQKRNTISRQQVKKIVAVVCVVCFIAVFLLSTVHFRNHTDYANQTTTSCKRTLLPECKCETILIQARTTIQVQAQSHSHNELHIDCMVCVIVQKTIDQTRQLSITLTDFLFANISLLIFIALGTLFLLISVSSPIKLKTRTNN